MSGFKTVVFWVFVALALGAGVYAYFNLKSNKRPKADALSVIPDNCLVYLNTNDFFGLNKKINSQSLIADKLKLFGDVNVFCNTIGIFDSLFMSDGVLREEIEGNLIHFAYYGKSGWLAAFNIKRLGNEETIKNDLAKLLEATKNKDDNYEFRIHKNSTYYFNLNSGIILISSTNEQINRALAKSESKLENNKAYLAFKNTLSENNLLSIYVDHALYSESKAGSALNLTYSCKKGHSAGVIDFQPSQIKINGYLNPDSAEIISFFRDQEPQVSADVITYLPVNTVSFKAYGFSSFPALREKLGTVEAISGFWKNRNERALYDLEKEFNENLVNHLIGFETTTSRRRFLSIEIKDTLKAAEQLQFMSDSIYLLSPHVIYQLDKDSVAPPIEIFRPLLNTGCAYAAIYQSHLFFSENGEELAQVLSDLKNGRVLSADESFLIYKNQHFADDYNYLIYTSPNQVKPGINPFFNFKTQAASDPFANFKHLSFSISHQGDNFKFRFQLMNESESRTKNKNVLWTLNLDTTAAMTAESFVNHITGENELIIQDDQNTLYLINAKGTILWRKKLAEKIISPVSMVDIYKKEKYQMLFNTKNYLHLIDRNGKYVEGYPVKLPAHATSALSVFDYDGDKDYRLLIACADNFIYNFSIHGARQEKFSPVKTDDEVNLPVQYVKVGPSDYLVALDKEGKIYTFSRKGVGRIGLRNRAVAGCQAFYADAGNTINSAYLIYVDDKNGLINKISFSDKKEIVKLNSEIENASVNFSMVDDNRGMDLIITKNNTIQAYNFSGNLIVERTSVLPLKKTNFYNDESHSLFYSLSEDKNEIVISDELKLKTKTLKASALPLVSNLFRDNKKYLIITHGKHVSCMLLN